MKKIVFCIAFVALLSACGGDQTPEPKIRGHEAAPSGSKSPSRPRPIPAPEDEQGVDILISEGIEFKFPHLVRYDILDTSRSGTRRHRVLIEVRKGDFNTVAQQFSQSMIDLGYARSKNVNKGGRIEQVFKRKGKPTHYLLMQPAGMGPRLRDKDSVGTIHVMWNIKR
jgi:hypothetical protein